MLISLTLRRALFAGLASCALACASSNDSSPPSNAGSNAGGSSAGAAGSSAGGENGGSGGVTSAGGSAGNAGNNGSSGSSTSGGASGTGGSGATGGDAGGQARDASGTEASSGSEAGAAEAGQHVGPDASGGSACAGEFCDDFERGTLGADWSVDNSVPANMIEIVATMAHSGNSSVHMKFAATAGNTFIRSTKGFPASMNSLWGRVWLYVATTATGAGHDVYIEASNGTNITNTGVRPLNTQGGTMQINVAPPDNGADSKMALPRSKWTCFEWQIAATGGSGNVVLYMNGTQIAAAMNKPIPELIFQRVGYEHYASGDGGEMWIDDYAIGKTRLNCN